MDKLQAIGREIRYVEYKLRRQQQEKKKKKQNRDAWMNGSGGNGSGLDSGSAKFGQEVRASEITFNDDSSKFETDRPANKHEEDLQLELALAMSRDEQTKEKSSSGTISTPAAPPVVQPPAPVQTASLLDISFDNQQQQQQQPAAAAVQSSPWGGQPAAPQQQAQSSWDPFSNTGAQQPVEQSNQAAAQSPWETPTSSSPPAQSGGGAWQAFDDSFQPPTNPQPVAAAPQQSANIITPAPPAQNNVGAVPDLFGAPLAPSSTQQAAATPANNQPVDDLFGASDPNQNTQMQNEILKPKKTASDFLGGKGASLVNLDNLVSRPSIPGGNPFGGAGGSGMKPNPFQKTSPGVPMSQMSKPMNGFDSSGGGMVPLQPTSANIMSPTGSNQAGTGSQYNSVFSSQPSNLLFGAQPMSSGHYQNKNPFS